jgi:hypothetical protein
MQKHFECTLQNQEVQYYYFFPYGYKVKEFKHSVNYGALLAPLQV